MGETLYNEFKEAREVFERVDEALQRRLSRDMFRGVEAELAETSTAQPAIFAHSAAVLAVLQVRSRLSDDGFLSLKVMILV